MSLLLGTAEPNRDVKREGKSVDGKLAVAAAMKAKTTVTNRWLAEHLKMGNVEELIRKVAQWVCDPDFVLAKKTSNQPHTNPIPHNLTGRLIAFD